MRGTEFGARIADDLIGGVEKSSAITPATVRSGHARPVQPTSAAATITAILAIASLRLNSQIAFTLASPSRKRARSNAAVTLTARATIPIPPINSASGTVAFSARQIAKAITPRPSAPRNSPCVSATCARARADQASASRPIRLIEPSPMKSSEFAFNAWLSAMKPPTSSHRPKPRLSATTIVRTRR